MQLRTIESLSSADERAAISAACAAAAHTRRPKKPRGGLRPLPTGSGEAEPSAAAARLSELGFEAAAIGAVFIFVRAASRSSARSSAARDAARAI